MKNRLTKLIAVSQIALHRFKNDQRGILATEYALIITTITLLMLSAFTDGGAFDAMFRTIWQTISGKVLTALAA